MQRLGHVTMLVRDYDEAIDFYVGKVGFELLTDNDFGDGLRWVTAAPSRNSGSAIVFVKADTDEKRARVGSQSGSHVFIVVETEDCWRDYERMKNQGITFFGEPQNMPWGIEVVFEDLYGNKLDLLQPREGTV